ncbi:MAG: glutamate mutase L [Planctomycetota bacterium]|nr:glutamate mutase L [Planctomycetota bacterium]
MGGATTDVFSVFFTPDDHEPIFNRTVSANLGMSYSISNVVAEATLPKILRWVPFDIDERDLRNRIRNKMIRPTTIPQTLEELMVEQAICREALRLAFEQHKSMAVTLKGVQKARGIGDAFEQEDDEGSLVNLMKLNMLVGAGGVLSHAPRRQQSALLLLDGFLPEGVTLLTVDSIFMMPQLGVLAKVHEEAALEVFHKDCLIYLGTAVAPVGKGKDGEITMNIKITMPDGKVEERECKYGSIEKIPLAVDEEATAEITPKRKFDVGAGRGKPLTKKLHGGVVGIILDSRGRRPFNIPDDPGERVKKLLEWNKALDIYPEHKFEPKEM